LFNNDVNACKKFSNPEDEPAKMVMARGADGKAARKARKMSWRHQLQGGILLPSPLL
jgi:hypothetical protein